jgi:CubicO group peptidase (beta-lactamase class C family)
MHAGSIGTSPPAVERLGRLFEKAIRARAFPGAAVALGRPGSPTIVRCYGALDYEGGPAVTPRTLYDVACMTKPLAVGALLMRLVADGFDLDAPVAEVLPAFGHHGKERTTWTNLLVHAGGLRPSLSYGRLVGASREEVVRGILDARPRFPPGSRWEYSCDGYICLGFALERLLGRDLDTLVRERICGPLGMRRTRYVRAGERAWDEVAPTGTDGILQRGPLCGVVEEPLAWSLGGVAGNAGLFTCLDDLVRFARTLVGDRPSGTEAIFDAGVVARFARPVDPARFGTRALGWDTRSPTGYTVAGRALGEKSFGHTGNTGCSLWIDPADGLWVALLSNANHPVRGRRRYVRIRPRLSEIAAAALRA